MDNILENNFGVMFLVENVLFKRCGIIMGVIDYFFNVLLLYYLLFEVEKKW